MTARAARAMSLSLLVLVDICWHIILTIEETFLLLFELVEKLKKRELFLMIESRRISFSFGDLSWVDS